MKAVLFSLLLKSDEDSSLGCLLGTLSPQVPKGSVILLYWRNRFERTCIYVLGNFFPNPNLGCFSLIFVPLPAAQDSLENTFGDWVFWGTWMDDRKMEEPVNLAETWKSWDKRSLRLHTSQSHKLYWSRSKQFRPAWVWHEVSSWLFLQLTIEWKKIA